MQYHTQACASTPWGTRQGEPHPKPSPYSGWENHDSLKRTHSHAKPLFLIEICPFIVTPEVTSTCRPPSLLDSQHALFLTCFLNTFETLKKTLQVSPRSGPRASWGQHVRFSTPTWASKTIPKPSFLRLQDPLYLKMPQTPKLDESSTLGPHFASPKPTQNPSKIL